ncbi:MAG: hypothetical protein ABI273_19365 [Lacunisphaera sp.]
MIDSSPATSSAPASDRPLVVTFWLMLVVALWCWSLSWKAPILDRHDFRQLQTAESTFWLKQDGFRLDYETPLFGPPSWSIPMEFPVYEWCVAEVSRFTGLPLDQSGRATSILFLLATLPAICGLAGLAGLSRPGQLLVAAVVLSSPVYLFYGRTFMIESTALCFSTWFLLGIGRCVRDLSWRWSVVATICGVLAALAKVTTFAVYCFPAAGLARWLGWPYWQQTRKSAATQFWAAVALCGLPVLIAVIIGDQWVQHADAIKNANPFSGFLKSSEMTAWNWGTLDQRLSLTVWNEVWSNVRQFVLSESAAVVVLIGATVVATNTRRFALASAFSFLAGPLLFTNLYYRHDYYYSANALLLLGAAGVLLAGMWNSKALPRPAKLAALALFFGAQLLCFYRGYGFNHRRQLPQPPAIATIIRETVPRDGVVLIYGWDWDSRIPYYSQRRAIMVPGGREDELKVLEDVVGQLPPLKIDAMLIKQRVPTPFSPEFIRGRLKRFGLSSAPIATSADGDLYLAENVTEPAAAKLKAQSFTGAVVNGATDDRANPDHLTDANLATLDLGTISPHPTSARSKFGLKTGEYDGHTVLFAHPISEVKFIAPPGAKAISFAFGLVDAAYAKPGGDVTDGVEFWVYELRPDGLQREIFHRELNPAQVPADRGPQTVHLNDAGPFTGSIIFKTTPGPKNNFVNDWAYWSAISIK